MDSFEPAWITPIIADDSPLYRLRANLPPTHAGWLCAIRFMIETSDLAYRRMCVTLDQATMMDSSAPSRTAFVSSLADAWSFLDGAHRILELLDRLPTGMRADAPLPGAQPVMLSAFREALGGTKRIKALRKLVQHPDDWAPKTAQNGGPPLGTLSWLARRDGASTLCMLVPGPPPAELQPRQRYRGGDPAHRVDVITFHWQEHDLDLSCVHAHIRSVSGQLATNLVAEAPSPITPWEAALIRQRIVFAQDVEALRRSAPRYGRRGTPIDAARRHDD